MYYIAHYGVGHLKGGNSGRYKWGSGQRPMQSAPGFKNKRSNPKKDIIDSGDAKLVKKHANELTNKQLEDAIKRIELNERLDRKIKDKSATRRMTNAVKTVSGTLITAAATYSAYKTLKKAFK